MRRRFLPGVEACELRLPLDGEVGGLGPSPEVQSDPLGGVLDDRGTGDLTEAPPQMGTTGPVMIDATDPFA